MKHSLGPRAASSPGTSLQNPPEERRPRVPAALPEGRAPLAPPPFPTSYPRQAVTSLRTETRASTLEPLTTAPAAGDSALWAVKCSMLSGRIQLIGRVTSPLVCPGGGAFSAETRKAPKLSGQTGGPPRGSCCYYKGYSVCGVGGEPLSGGLWDFFEHSTHFCTF